MSAGGPDLFVICKNCRSEVSPYITECPYCGNRLRKRAPKIDREGRVSERRRRRTPAPALPRLKRGEIPGIRGELRPHATMVLVVLGVLGCLLWRTALVNIDHLAILYNKPGDHWWRLITTTFTYANTGYAFVALVAIALYGWLLERRHGPLVVIALFALGGVGGTLAAAAVYANPVVLGANGAALAMIVAWSLPDLVALRTEREYDGDLLGTAVFGAVVALLPLADVGATWPAAGIGLLAGLAIGIPLLHAGEG